MESEFLFDFVEDGPKDLWERVNGCSRALRCSFKIVKGSFGIQAYNPQWTLQFQIKLKLFIPVVLSSLKHPKVVVQVYSKTKYVKIWFQ